MAEIDSKLCTSGGAELIHVSAKILSRRDLCFLFPIIVEYYNVIAYVKLCTNLRTPVLIFAAFETGGLFLRYESLV